MSILLLVTVDTEEDNWRPERRGITVENIAQMPVLAECLDQLGLRPTYFTTYQVARHPWAADILREVVDGARGEIGAHLHPWNTPPMREAMIGRNSMMKNLPTMLQRAKLERLTVTLEDAFGTAPTAFRAGRFGIDAAGVDVLVGCGYRVDSSVTPYFCWDVPDDGPSFIGAPLDAYRISAESGFLSPDPSGPLAEIPLTSGYTGFSSRRWRTIYNLLHSPRACALPTASLASRLRISKRTMLSPESESLRDMLALTRGGLDGGARYLQLFLHSPTLQPGLTPWTATPTDVVRLYAKIDRYLEKLSSMTSWRSATIGEAQRALCGEVPGGAMATP